MNQRNKLKKKQNMSEKEEKDLINPIQARLLESLFRPGRGGKKHPPWKTNLGVSDPKNYTVNYTYIERTYPRGQVSSCHRELLAAAPVY